jgi:hypothetical protein
MKHRRKLAAVAVVAMGLIFVGLGARKEVEWVPEPPPEKCTTDLEAVFDWCEAGKANGCKYATRSFAAACQASCVMRLCPEQARCTGLDPIFCAPCTDEHGALHWYLAGQALDRCYDLAGRNDGSWDDCVKGYFKEHCPAWDGKWRTWEPDDEEGEE